MNHHNRMKKLALASGFALATIMSGSAGAALNISQTPLFISSSVDPNVMFLLDDSGSMHWEHMPDSTQVTNRGRRVNYMYPRHNNTYTGGNSDALSGCVTGGGGGYKNNPPKFGNGNRWATFFRSPNNNAVYYNPAITYQPWKRADGTSFPNANPSAALNNPVNPNIGTRNLVTSLTERAIWVDADGEDNCQNYTYYPSTYYRYNGGDIMTPSNYTEVRITATGIYSGEGRDNRTDCSAGVCSGAQEVQNFANWYTYYRSRLLAARGGLGIAMADQSAGMRVGFGTINKGTTTVDGVSQQSVITGVRPYRGSDKDQFYDDLYNVSVPPQGTPLRTALRDMGNYFSRTDNRGPWGRTPGTNDGTPQLECRKSFGILMTDGFWNGSSPGSGNQDGTGGTTMTSPSGETFQYAATDPFQDGRSSTLADTAMNYWKNDLRTDLANRVRSSERNPAFWQHMVTYGVGFGVSGNVDPTAAFDAINTGTPINWGDPFNNNQAKIDDLLHAGVNTRGGFFSASDPATFSDEFGRIIEDIIARSRATTSLSSASTRLNTTSLIFEGSFDSENWEGDLQALDLEGNIAWVASQQLPLPAARTFLTFDGTTGTTFSTTMSAALKADIQTGIETFTGATPAEAALLVNPLIDFIRGDQSNERQNGGEFRNRTKLLGDIVNSEPVFYGTGNLGWSRLDSSDGGGTSGPGSYGDYIDNTKPNRDRLVIVGANDGALHGFNANTGVEVFAYVPRSVMENLVLLTDPNYVHRFYVDASPTIGDAYLNSGWKTVLVGATGAGGRAIFALDVGSGSFGIDDVMWEFSSLNDTDLGFTIEQSPIITRIADGRWVAIFGNGYNSLNNNGVLFVVNLADGTLIRKLNTGVGSNANPAGLGSPRVITDPGTGLFANFVYVGDLQGNMWKFDISSPSPGSWGSAISSGGNPAPLFQARSGAGLPQPITASPTLARIPQGGTMVYFGSGKLFEVGDASVTSSSRVETFYAVLDDLQVTDDDNPIVPPAGRGDLTQVRILSEETSANGTMVRNVEETSVNLNVSQGFYIDLIVGSDVRGERVVSMPQVQFGTLLFTTFEPTDDECEPGGTPRLYILDALSGAPRNLEYLEDLGLSGSGGGIALGPGAPVDPPVLIDSRPPVDPDDPNFDPDADPTTIGDCGLNETPVIILDPVTLERIVIGCIREGRVVWGER